MIESERERLRELREKDESFLSEFVEALREKHVEVVDSITTEISANYVQIKIIDKLKKHMQYRADLIERELCTKLPASEVKHYEASYTYKHSKFGTSSPLSPFNPIKTKNFAVLYRERIYFPADEDERTNFMLEPSKYTMNVEPTPLDLNLRPTVVVMGLPKSGKTTLAACLAKNTGMIHLEPSAIVEMFVDRDCYQSKTLSMRIRQQGKEMDDATMVDLITHRVNMKDCIQNGWVLDGFPQTRQQALLMVKKGLNPLNVFHL
jgi:hypothetical protein